MSAVSNQATNAAPEQAATLKSDCFHCGLPLPSAAQWTVKIEGIAQPMCCPGCQAVAQTIVDNGFTDYYRTRSVFSSTADKVALVSPQLHLYDTPEAASQFNVDDHSAEATLAVEGIRCAACVWLIERRLARVSGVQSAHMNIATEKLQVRWSRDACKLSDILQAVHALGYTAYPYDTVRHGEQLRKAGKTLSRQLFIAGLSMMQVMMYAVPAYLADDGTMDASMAGLLRWASLLLTLPAVCYSAQPFFLGAWNSLKHRALDMDVPVALGITAAFVASTVATWRGQGEVYFDSVTMFIFLLLCSRYFEFSARRKAASALETLHHALPASASRIANYPAGRDTEMVAAAHLIEGDLILVKPGEAIAADGVIVEGDTAIDLSLLTGESRPQRKGVGDLLAGGAINASQAIVLRVTRPASESTFASLVKLVERAGQAKPQLALWADKVAAYFVGALLLFAVIVFGTWEWIDPARAWPIAIAVLVVSCPCALSLATPTALAAATDRLVRQGVLVVQPHVLETLHRATHIIFDKTGTVTLGKPSLQRVDTFGARDRATCIRLAAAMEASNAHPIAQALTAAARELAAPNSFEACESQHFIGQGLETMIDGRCYRLGSAEFVAQLTGSTCKARVDDDTTQIYLGTSGECLARFDLADAIRDDAHAVIAQFQRQGKRFILLSGDRQAVTQRVADAIGIDAAFGDYLPEQKLAFVQQLQETGAVVAMVGDGINDAAVLRAADVSFAMGSGAALAQAHADTVLLSGRLTSVWETAQVASKTMAIIQQNLAWATLYNLVAIPAAALGYLNPWLSGIGMSLSSAMVVANALRLRRVPRQVQAPESVAEAFAATAGVVADLPHFA